MVQTVQTVKKKEFNSVTSLNSSRSVRSVQFLQRSVGRSVDGLWTLSAAAHVILQCGLYFSWSTSLASLSKYLLLSSRALVAAQCNFLAVSPTVCYSLLGVQWILRAAAATINHVGLASSFNWAYNFQHFPSGTMDFQGCLSHLEWCVTRRNKSDLCVHQMSAQSKVDSGIPSKSVKIPLQFSSCLSNGLLFS